MPDPSESGPYRIDQIPSLKQQIRELGEQATHLGLRTEYLSALRLMLDKLKSDPVHWGDPEYHTAHPGGIVCHGVCNPLFVRYVIYTGERVVVILKLSLISGLPKPST